MNNSERSQVAICLIDTWLHKHVIGDDDAVYSSIRALLLGALTVDTAGDEMRDRLLALACRMDVAEAAIRLIDRYAEARDGASAVIEVGDEDALPHGTDPLCDCKRCAEQQHIEAGLRQANEIKEAMEEAGDMLAEAQEEASAAVVAMGKESPPDMIDTPAPIAETTAKTRRDGDGNRTAMLAALAKLGRPATIHDLFAESHLPHTTIKYALESLERAGKIKTAKQGQSRTSPVLYSLPSTVEELAPLEIGERAARAYVLARLERRENIDRAVVSRMLGNVPSAEAHRFFIGVQDEMQTARRRMKGGIGALLEAVQGGGE